MKRALWLEITFALVFAALVGLWALSGDKPQERTVGLGVVACGSPSCRELLAGMENAISHLPELDRLYPTRLAVSLLIASGIEEFAEASRSLARQQGILVLVLAGCPDEISIGMEEAARWGVPIIATQVPIPNPLEFPPAWVCLESRPTELPGERSPPLDSFWAPTSWTTHALGLENSDVEGQYEADWYLGYDAVSYAAHCMMRCPVVDRAWLGETLRTMRDAVGFTGPLLFDRLGFRVPLPVEGTISGGLTASWVEELAEDAQLRVTGGTWGRALRIEVEGDTRSRQSWEDFPAMDVVLLLDVTAHHGQQSASDPSLLFRVTTPVIPSGDHLSTAHSPHGVLSFRRTISVARVEVPDSLWVEASLLLLPAHVPLGTLTDGGDLPVRLAREGHCVALEVLRYTHLKGRIVVALAVALLCIAFTRVLVGRKRQSDPG